MFFGSSNVAKYVWLYNYTYYDIAMKNKTQN